jgi:HAMP domain-containing protein
MFFLCVILVVLVGTVVYSLTSTFLQESIRKNNEEIAVNTLDKIDRFINERIVDIQFLSELSSVSDVLLKQNQNDPNQIQSSNKKLTELVSKNSVWWDISVVNLDGKIISSTDKSKLESQIIRRNQEFSSLIQKALEGQPAYSDLIKIDQSEKLTIALVAPVWSKDINPKIIGVVSANLAWPTIVDILGSLHIQEARLINKHGLLIASNIVDEKNQIFEKDLVSIYKLIKSNNNNIGTIIAQDQNSDELALLSYTEQVGYESFSGNQWTLLLEVSLSTAYLPAKNAAFTLVTIFTIVISSALFIGLILLKKYIVSPIEKLNKSVKSITKGNLDQRVDIHSKGEFGELAFSFNQMTEKIQQAQETLESQVESKTKELSEKVKELEKLNRVMVDREILMIELKEKNKILEDKINK